MRLVMSTDSIVDDLKLFRGFHSQPSHVPDPSADLYYVFVLVVFQPSRLAYPVLGGFQFASFGVLHRRSFKLKKYCAKQLITLTLIGLLP